MSKTSVYSSKEAAGTTSGAGSADVRLVQHDHFHCFCYKVFYFSNFKDFNTISPAF